MSVEYAFFCDDVRQENSGKLIAIGIYSGVLQTEQFPMRSPIAAVLAFHTQNPRFEVNAKYSLASGAELGTARFEAEIDDFDHTITLVPIPRISLQLSREDELILTAWLSGDEPKEVGRLKVVKADTASEE